MNKIKCDICKGTGYIRKFNHIENGVCFTCEGKGFYTVDNEAYKKHIERTNGIEGTYFLFEEGKIIKVVKSKEVIHPNKKTE